MVRYTNKDVPSWSPPSALKSLGILSRSLASRLSCASDRQYEPHSFSADLDPLHDIPRSTPPSEFDAPCSSVRSVWAGHATVVTDFPTSDPAKPFRVVFDPLFEKSCSPVKWPRRRVDVPFSIEDMGRVDAVVISHNHYDHLSKSSIDQIEALPGSTKYFVPLGTKKWFVSRNIDRRRIFELDWWEGAQLGGVGTGFEYLGPSGGSGGEGGDPEEYDDRKGVEVEETRTTIPLLTRNAQNSDKRLEVEIADDLSLGDDSSRCQFGKTNAATYSGDNDTIGLDVPVGFTITCTPAQHADGRDFLLRDKGRTKCATWVIDQHPLSTEAGDTEGTKVFFGGDTGYRSAHNGPVASFVQEVRDRFGAINLLLLPAASGSLSSRFGLPNALVRHMHATPDDAVDMSNFLSGYLDAIALDGEKSPVARMGEGYSDKTATIFIHHSTFDSKAGAKKTMRGLMAARSEKGDLSNEWTDGGKVAVRPGVWQDMADL